MNRKPIGSVGFWRHRLKIANESGNLRGAVYRTLERNWRVIDNNHKKILENYITTETTVLDAGCGYGRCSRFFNMERYIGVDFCKEFIEIAKKLHPHRLFHVQDLRNTFYEDEQFSYVVGISLQQMVCRELGTESWKDMEKELLRISELGVIMLEYGGDDPAEGSKVHTLIRKIK